MRPSLGVSLEILALGSLLASAPLFHLPLFAVYVIAAQLLAAYLVHCPAHYAVGSALGIRFRSISLGTTTITESMPSLGRLVRLLPVPYLSTVRASLASATPRGAAAMYAAGVVASVSSVLVIAVAATWVEPPVYAVPAWVLALSYLASDVVLSPKSGDLRKARSALRARPPS